MKSARSMLHCLAIGLFAMSAVHQAKAVTMTYTGTFTTDDQVAQFMISVPTSQIYTFYTTSYGGGANLNGTTTPAGGFVPVLSLFNSTGMIVGSDGGSGMCRGAAMPGAGTGLCDDAYLVRTLAAGNYTLVLTEFPNVAIGSLSDGFLFAGSPNATGDVCGVSGGKFLQSDVAPCVQRTGNYSVDVSSATPVPEPASWILVLPAALLLGFVSRNQFAS